MFDYRNTADLILSEIKDTLRRTPVEEIDRLVDALMGAEKVFIFAVGRVFLSLQCLGKRLGHVGIDCQIVGAVNEKPIGPNDLMLIASGSGESKLPAEIARIAKSKGAKLALITSARESTIKSMSEIAVHLPSPTKNDASAGTASIQSMSTLFDQSLHILSDVVTMAMQDRKGLENAELWKYHANLE